MPYGIAVADVDRDGKRDLAVSDTGITASKKQVVSVLYGKGDPKFTTPKPQVVGATKDPEESYLGSTTGADLNRDGLRDIVAVNKGQGKRNYLAVILNLGHRRFAHYRGYHVPSYGNYLVAARFNRDPAADIATPIGAANVVSVLLNRR